MDQRHRKAERILAVREQLQRAAEWRLADASRERTRLEETRQELLATLSSDLLGPLLVEHAARHLQRVATQSARAEARHRAEEVRVREETLATKRAERLAEVASRAARAASERKHLSDIAEASALRAPQAARSMDAVLVQSSPTQASGAEARAAEVTSKDASLA